MNSHKKCKTKGCKNKAMKDRTICCTCKSKRYKEKYVLNYIFQTLKDNAKRRGKDFTLTLDEFKEFCEKTGYDKKRGKTAWSLSIDRRDPCLGYSKDNIRAITLSDNSKLANGTIVDVPDYLKLVEEECPY